MSVSRSFFIKFVLRIQSNHDLQTVWLSVFMYFSCFGFTLLLHVISFLLVLQSSTESSRTRMEFMMLKNPKTNNNFFKIKKSFKSSMKMKALYILSIHTIQKRWQGNQKPSYLLTFMISFQNIAMRNSVAFVCKNPTSKLALWPTHVLKCLSAIYREEQILFCKRWLMTELQME